MAKKYILVVLIAVLLAGCGTSPKATPTELGTSIAIPTNTLASANMPEPFASEAPVLLVNTPTTLLAEKPTDTPRPQSTLRPTSTSIPSSTPTSAPDPSIIFALNYGGELEQDNIKVEVARVLFGQKAAIEAAIGKPGAFDAYTAMNGQEYIGEVIWRITNNTQGSISWSWSDISARVNGRQIKLENYMVGGVFGETPTDEIFPGSTIIGGVYFGIGNTKPNNITSFDLLMGSPHDPATYHDVSSKFIITVDLSGKHEWNPMPDELK